MNCLQKLIQKYPRELWCKRELSKNPNCPRAFFYLSDYASWFQIREFSQNPSLKYSDILENPCSGWDWNAISENKGLVISPEQIRYMPEVYNHLMQFCRSRRINQYDCAKYGTGKNRQLRCDYDSFADSVFDMINTPPDVLINTLRDLHYPYKQVAVVLQHPNMKFDIIYNQLWPEIVKRNPFLAMEYSRDISLNPNITYEIVTSHPYMLWDFERLSQNLFNFHPGKMALAIGRISRAWRSHRFRQRLAIHRIWKRVLDSILYFPGKGELYLNAYSNYLRQSHIHDSTRNGL